MQDLIRHNHNVISAWIENGSRVLDLGCGDGTLLKSLAENKQVEGLGIEICQDMIISCLKKGLCVYQADMDRELQRWEDNSFDYVILNATLQSVLNPDRIIDEMLRVGCNAVISISNFGYIRNRLRVLTQGRVSNLIRFEGSWYDSPVTRFVSLNEFYRYLDRQGIMVADARFFLPFNSRAGYRTPLDNLLVREAIFKLRRRS